MSLDSKLTGDCVCKPSRSFKDSDAQVSPTSATGSRLGLSPSSTTSNVSLRDHRMSDLAGYRRDLAILDPSGGRGTQNQQGNPATGSLSQIAPWMAGNGGASTPSSTGAIPTSFYNDSTDNLSIGSQLSPGIRPATRPSQTTAGSSTDSPDAVFFPDERRPSIASITTTASSQGSRTSGTRGGFRKLQGFFGEEFPGRDSSETSLSQPTQGKEHRSHSYSHARPHRDRNYSNATDHPRDQSPSSSRPRTPVPAPEVVPFLYQEAEVRHLLHLPFQRGPVCMQAHPCNCERGAFLVASLSVCLFAIRLIPFSSTSTDAAVPLTRRDTGYRTIRRSTRP